jgi:hypothetical protein
MTILRGRVKFYDQGWGFLEVPGRPEHYYRIKSKQKLAFDTDGLRFEADGGELRLPKEGDWLVFTSHQQPKRARPEAIQWDFLDELQAMYDELVTDATQLGKILFDCLKQG